MFYGVMSEHKEIKTLAEIFMDKDLLEICNEEQKKQFENDLIETWNLNLTISPCEGIIDAFKNPRSRT